MAPVAVEVRRHDGVAAADVVDDLPAPLVAVLEVDDHLRPVPGLYRRHEVPLAEPPGLHLARPALRPRRGVARRDLLADPVAVHEAVHVDAREAGRERGVARRIVPRLDEQPVHHALPGIGHGAARPVVRPVPVDRHCVAILGGLGRRAGERRRHQHGAAGAVDVRPADAVHGGRAVYLAGLPGLGRVAVVRQQGQDAEAARVRRAEIVGEHHLGNPVAVEVARRGIDGPRDAGRHHVALPARVLVPGQLVEAGREADDVEPSVAVQVGDDRLVATRELRVDRVRHERRPALRAVLRRTVRDRGGQGEENSRRRHGRECNARALGHPVTPFDSESFDGLRSQRPAAAAGALASTGRGGHPSPPRSGAGQARGNHSPPSTVPRGNRRWPPRRMFS